MRLAQQHNASTVMSDVEKARADNLNALPGSWIGALINP
jgi:hypothetical protein